MNLKGVHPSTRSTLDAARCILTYVYLVKTLYGFMLAGRKWNRTRKTDTKLLTNNETWISEIEITFFTGTIMIFLPLQTGNGALSPYATRSTRAKLRGLGHYRKPQSLI